jgi:hypothetical protein
MRRWAALALAALGASGCAHSTWQKPGATAQVYDEDSYLCERDTRQSGYYGGGLVGAVNMQSFFNHCMVAHGWSLVSESAVPARQPLSFTEGQWESGRQQCHDQATAESETAGGDGFANAFNRCMVTRGL